MTNKDYTYNIVVEGGKRAIVDGIKRVTYFSQEKITLLIGRQLFDVYGKGLKIEEIGEHVVSITGEIDGVKKDA